MKSINKILLFIGLFMPVFLFSCTDDTADNPSFGEKDMPMIYMDWVENYAYKVGDVIRMNPQISPADGASYKWTFDGTVVSTEKNLEYTVNEFGTFTLQFEVERNGIRNSRIANVLVVKPFVPKTCAHKSIAYLTVDGSVADVPWNDITHLIVTSAVIGENGQPDMTFGGRNSLNISTLISTAHNYGVFVMLEFSGTITYLNATHAYGSLTFYDAAVSAERDALADNLIQTAIDNHFDGINIYMDKADDGAFKDPVTLTDFYTKVGSKLKSIDNTIDDVHYDYLLSMSVYAGWTNASLTGVVNIPAYDWINVLAFAAEDLTPGPQSAAWYFTDQITQWKNWYGVDPSRIVGAVPAFGLKYFGNIPDYNWGNLWQYTLYIPYSTICSTYSNAPDVNQQSVDNGLFYDGFPAITEKAQFVKDNKLAGMALWSIDSDSKEAAKSLMKKINRELGN